MTLKVMNFGCRLNAYESEVIRQEAQKAGLGDSGCPDAIIFNTCAVTAEAVRQARQSIRKERRDNPDARIIVTGCAAQIEPDNFINMKEIDLVLGNKEKLEEKSYRMALAFDPGSTEKALINDIMSINETASHMINAIDGRVRSFIQIQNGCDHRCTFCIIPYARGNSRSVPMGVVVEQIQRLVDNGCQEIILTGVDLTSYGLDLPGHPPLGQLVKTIFRKVPDIKRLRISSLDCIEIDKDLIEVITEERRLMPHLHLSLQAGDDLILKRMKRRHLRNDSIQFCQKIRQLRPEMVFGADLIAGFPTESQEMFENTLRLIDECLLTHLHIFPFSPRPGTPAARMPATDSKTVRKRAQRLREAANIVWIEHLERLKGTTQSILIESKGKGRTEDFTPCLIEEGTPGEIVTALVTGHNKGHLLTNIIAKGIS